MAEENETSEKISVDPAVIMATFQQLYPTEFAHVMSAVEAQYWREQAQKPRKRAAK